MAVIATILSCALGFLVGLFQVVVLGASFGQGFLTYLAVSAVLSALSILAAYYLPHDVQMTGSQDQLEDLEAWQDWQIEEDIEAEKYGAVPDDSDEDDQERRSA